MNNEQLEEEERHKTITLRHRRSRLRFLRVRHRTTSLRQRRRDFFLPFFSLGSVQKRSYNQKFCTSGANLLNERLMLTSSANSPTES